MPSQDRRQSTRPSSGSTLPAGVERRRQRAVESLGLGVPVRQRRDERFDRITRVASKVFAAAWSTITVLDGDHAWFPSAQGINTPLMPRSETFCSRTTAYGRVTVIPDATLDPDFSSLPIVVSARCQRSVGS